MNVGPVIKEIRHPVLNGYIVFKPRRASDYPGVGFSLIFLITVLVLNPRINTPELITDLFRRNSKDCSLELLEDLYESQIVKKIRNHQDIPKPLFHSQLQLFNQAFTSLCTLENTNNTVVSKILNRISTKMEKAKGQNIIDVTALVKEFSGSQSCDGEI